MCKQLTAFSLAGTYIRYVHSFWKKGWNKPPPAVSHVTQRKSGGVKRV